MNYQKIYSAFIADRRIREDLVPILDSYSEKHHIVPRALGGGDEPANLIRLTPEDHFFAHLLLAKIHGGEMWAPLKLMMGSHWRQYGQARRIHGFATRKAIESMRGENSPNFKHDLHTVVHRDGREITLRRGDMPDTLGIGDTGAYNLASKLRTQVSGWSLKGAEIDFSRGEKGRIYVFVNPDGRRFEGTQLQFHRAAGISRNAAQNVCRGRPSRTGWRLEGTPETQINGPNFGKGKDISLVRGAEKVFGKRQEVARAIGCTPDQLSSGLRWIAAGKSKTYKGWSYAC